MFTRTVQTSSLSEVGVVYDGYQWRTILIDSDYTVLSRPSAPGSKAFKWAFIVAKASSYAAAMEEANREIQRLLSQTNSIQRIKIKDSQHLRAHVCHAYKKTSVMKPAWLHNIPYVEEVLVSDRSQAQTAYGWCLN